MYSIDYFLARTPILRRWLRFWNTKKINAYTQKEIARAALNPLDLRHFERKNFSQNGEDGIIEEIFARIGTTNKYFVEFGIENGTECNTRYLLEKKSWQGLWMDGSVAHCQSAREKFSAFPITVVKTFITKDNIENILLQQNVPADLDLLSIDIDGNDFWVWQSISKYKPRVVVIEYNASFIPPQSWIMPYNENHHFDGRRYFGASLVAMNGLAQQKQYTLVGCDKMGVNAFFVRNDLINSHFLKESVDYFYSSPKYHCFFFGFPKGKGPWIKRN